MTDTDEVVLEPEEENGEGTLAQKLKQVRRERDQARKEVQEYLTGWQRTKADYVNLQKRMREAGETASEASIVAFARSVVQVFDSLEAACNTTTDDQMKKGMEQVAHQLEMALKEHGIVRYTPQAGDAFDPERHEPMQTLETLDGKQDNTIADVFQSGYIKGETVIRPARVAVNKHSN